MKTIVLTGGGTAGHVMPNVALLPKLREGGWTIHYIGSFEGIERQIVGALPEVTYHSVATGKLRRYPDIRNLRDPFRVLRGIGQAWRLLRRIRPAVIFSKGGYVSLPVIVAGRLLGIPSIIHESDITPGLANKLSVPFATHVCAAFPETLAHLPKDKARHVGLPIREQLFSGNAERGRALCGFDGSKPVILVMGGSLGSQAINGALREGLKELLPRFQVVHLCGRGNLDSGLMDVPGYKQFEYAGDELPDLLAMASVAVSRAGAGAIFELLALRIPMLLIPLSLKASRGDQILNAESFKQAGYGRVLPEEQLSGERLAREINRLYDDRAVFEDRMKQAKEQNAVDRILELIAGTAGKDGDAR